jgi:hypothetical protein
MGRMSLSGKPCSSMPAGALVYNRATAARDGANIAIAAKL